MTIYDYSVKDVKGQEVSLKDYQGKALLVVNTATGCGFTPQYEGLEDLYSKYKEEGFEVLDFPCNQFNGQAPGSNEEIQEFCQLKYNTSFQTFGKIEVNGEGEDPLYTFLKSEDKAEGKDIRWNFTKFLVDQEGNVVKRYDSAVLPKNIEADIKELLENK